MKQLTTQSMHVISGGISENTTTTQGIDLIEPNIWGECKSDNYSAA